MSYPTPATDAATTRRKLGTSLVHCRGCGHAIAQRSLMTTVHWWSDLHRPERLKTDRYHAECTPSFDAARVVLMRAGHEFLETWDHAANHYSIKLVPCQADHVVDTVTKEPVAHHMLVRFGFRAVATYSDRPHRNLPGACWHVMTRGNGHGSTRYAWYQHEQDARDHLEKWYRRRYRYADVRMPYSETS